MQPPPARMTASTTPPRRLGQSLAGLLNFPAISNPTERLVNDEVCYVAINDSDLYNRIYDEVLVYEAL